jgi:hypothetical protein
VAAMNPSETLFIMLIFFCFVVAVAFGESAKIHTPMTWSKLKEYLAKARTLTMKNQASEYFARHVVEQFLPGKPSVWRQMLNAIWSLEQDVNQLAID